MEHIIMSFMLPCTTWWMRLNAWECNPLSENESKNIFTSCVPEGTNPNRTPWLIAMAVTEPPWNPNQHPHWLHSKIQIQYSSQLVAHIRDTIKKAHPDCCTMMMAIPGGQCEHLEDRCDMATRLPLHPWFPPRPWLPLPSSPSSTSKTCQARETTQSSPTQNYQISQK